MATLDQTTWATTVDTWTERLAADAAAGGLPDLAAGLRGDVRRLLKEEGVWLTILEQVTVTQPGANETNRIELDRRIAALRAHPEWAAGMASAAPTLAIVMGSSAALSAVWSLWDQAVLLRDSVDPTQQLQWRALRALWVVAMRVVLPGSVPATAMAVVQGWVVGRRRLPFHSDKAPVLGEALGKTWALNLSDPTVAATKLKRVEDAGRCEVVRLHGGAFDVYPNCYDLGGGTVGMRWVPFVLAEPDGVNTNDEVAHRAVRELLGLDASARPNIFVHQYHPEIMGMWGEGQTLDGADAANGVHHKRGHLANVMVSGGYKWFTSHSGCSTGYKGLVAHAMWSYGGQTLVGGAYASQGTAIELLGADPDAVQKNLERCRLVLNWRVSFTRTGFTTDPIETCELNTLLMFFRDWVLRAAWLEEFERRDHDPAVGGLERALFDLGLRGEDGNAGWSDSYGRAATCSDWPPRPGRPPGFGTGEVPPCPPGEESMDTLFTRAGLTWDSVKYLNDTKWKQYCAENINNMANLHLNLELTPEGFSELFGTELGPVVWTAYCRVLRQAAHYFMNDKDIDPAVPGFTALWKRLGFSRDQVRPFHDVAEHDGYEVMRRDAATAWRAALKGNPLMSPGWKVDWQFATDVDGAHLSTFTQPLAPGESFPVPPQSASDMCLGIAETFHSLRHVSGFEAASAAIAMGALVQKRIDVSMVDWLEILSPVLLEMMLFEVRIGTPVEVVAPRMFATLVDFMADLVERMPSTGDLALPAEIRTQVEQFRGAVNSLPVTIPEAVAMVQAIVDKAAQGLLTVAQVGAQVAAAAGSLSGGVAVPGLEAALAQAQKICEIASLVKQAEAEVGMSRDHAYALYRGAVDRHLLDMRRMGAAKNTDIVYLLPPHLQPLIAAGLHRNDPRPGFRGDGGLVRVRQVATYLMDSLLCEVSAWCPSPLSQ